MKERMKKIYVMPAVDILKIRLRLMTVMSGNDTDLVSTHSDDPQDPGQAMSRGRGIWDDEL